MLWIWTLVLALLAQHLTRTKGAAFFPIVTPRLGDAALSSANWMLLWVVMWAESHPVHCQCWLVGEVLIMHQTLLISNHYLMLSWPKVQKLGVLVLVIYINKNHAFSFKNDDLIDGVLMCFLIHSAAPINGLFVNHSQVVFGMSPFDMGLSHKYKDREISMPLYDCVRQCDSSELPKWVPKTLKLFFISSMNAC